MNTRIHIVLATCALILFTVGDTYGQLAKASPGACYVTTGGSAGHLYTIDLANGAVTLVGVTGLNGMPAVAIDSDGNIFAAERRSGDLYRLDAANGTASLVGTMTIEATALAFDAADVLYATGPFGEFGTVDSSSGVWSIIRNEASMSGYSGLAFDSLGVLYGSTGNAVISPPPVVGIDSIGIINTADGSETLVGETGVGGGTPDIAFDSSGKLFAVKGGGRGSNSLIEISATNGSLLSTVGPVSVVASGLACYNAPAGPPPPVDEKVYVCHEAESGITKTLHIDALSLQAHLDHGDIAGECDEDNVANGRKGKKNGKFDASSTVPDYYGLSQNYPNPFNPRTTISFALPEAASVRLAVYNAVGQEVKVLVSSTLEAGTHAATWNATDRTGQRVATGMYIYRLTAGNHIETRKMLLLE